MGWKRGDYALCIKRGKIYPSCFTPGALFKVAYVWHGVAEFADSSNIDTCLDFFEVPRMPGDLAYWHGNFRKVTPDEADAFDREVIEALKSEPVHVPQHDALHNGCQCEVLDRFNAAQVRQ